jgi:hypothetical protein
MKAFILPSLLFLGLSAHAQTQVSEQFAEPVRAQDSNPTQIILKAVPSFGTLNGLGSGAPSGDSRLFGIGFGAAIDLSLGSTWSAELGVEWARRGWTENGAPDLMDDAPAGDSYQNIRLNYLVVPALMKAKFGDAQSTRFFVGAGPYVGFFLSGVETKKSPFSQNESTETITNVGTDFGFRTSLGVEIPASSSLGIVLGGQYDFGLANIAQDSLDPNFSINTGSLLLNAGLAIRL